MPILEQQPHVYPDALLTDTFPRELDDLSVRRSWWAIYTKARQEKALGRDLYRFQVPYYLPLVPRDNLIRGRRVRSYVPLFAGYVFLYGTDDERVKCLTTNRVSRILCVEDGQTLWRDLRNIEQLIACDAPLTVERRLAPGQLVRIRSGSMCGVEGIVHRRQGKTRLVVRVDFLQQGASIEIDDFQVEPV